MRSKSIDVLRQLAETIRDCHAQGIGEEEVGRRLLEIDPDNSPGLVAAGLARVAARSDVREMISSNCGR